jgi:hypothetical protein
LDTTDKSIRKVKIPNHEIWHTKKLVLKIVFKMSDFLKQKTVKSWSRGLTLLPRIREVPVSNPGPETCYPDSHFPGFPQSLQGNAGIVS